jgi:tRNA (guanine37-N1)-methyltransferase
MEEPFVEFTGPVISRNQWRKLKYRRRDGEAPHLTQDTLPPSLAQNKGASAGFRRRIDQFVMNLPDTAIEFLDAFRGAFREDEEAAAAVGRAWEVKAVYDRMPTVHCHCFTRELDAVNAKKDILMVCIPWICRS